MRDPGNPRGPGEPALLKLGRRPVGVIVSLGDFGPHFAPKVAEDERRRLVQEILADRVPRAVAGDQTIAGLHSRPEVGRIEANHS